MSSWAGDLFHYPFLVQVWGTVADWFAAVGTVAAVATAAGYYINDKRADRREEQLGALRTWLENLRELAIAAKALADKDDPDSPGKIVNQWIEYGDRDPQRSGSPTGVLIRELNGRLITSWSAQVGYPHIVPMTTNYMIMWIDRARNECASWIATGPPSGQQLKVRFDKATEQLSEGSQALADAQLKAQERAAEAGQP